VNKKEGNAKKTGNAYLFYAASVVDEDGNVFALNLADALVSTPENVAALLDVRNERAEVDVNFKPRGFDIAGTIEAIHAPKK